MKVKVKRVLLLLLRLRFGLKSFDDLVDDDVHDVHHVKSSSHRYTRCKCDDL
jgi:hypothetical protein